MVSRNRGCVLRRMCLVGGDRGVEGGSSMLSKNRDRCLDVCVLLVGEDRDVEGGRCVLSRNKG